MGIRSISEYISFLLLGIIILGISSSLYLWGVPIIQKNTLNGNMQNVEQQLITLANDIQNIGINGGQTSLQLSIPTGTLSESQNSIVYTLSLPSSSHLYYNPIIRSIPVNYNVFYPCYANNTLTIGQKINLCDYPGLYAYANSTDIVIYDKLYNSSLILPLGNYYYVITSGYVFNIQYQNNEIIFYPLYNTGLYGNSNYPACIINVQQIQDIVQYNLECRPLYDPQTKLCYWIFIQPSGSLSLTGNGVAQISSQGTTISNSYKSTICKAVEVIDVQVSL